MTTARTTDSSLVLESNQRERAARATLPDLVQANVDAVATCRVVVKTPLGRGEIYLLKGRVVDATAGDLTGTPAFYALMGGEVVDTVVEPSRTTPRRTIEGDWYKLLFEVMKLKEERRVPTPVFAGEPASKTLPILATGLAVLAIGASALFLVRGRSATPEASPAVPVQTAIAPKARAPVEANDLTGPGDEAPRLLSGSMPSSPDPSMALKPEIICRVLVDETGKVVDAKIYRSRLDLASFEEAALGAVRSFRFTAARKARVAVPVWTNVPVSFQ